MATGYIVRKNQYYDSVFLMGVNKRLSLTQGVKQTAVLMGTENNKQLLDDIGLRGAEITAAQPSDLIVGVIADTKQVVDDVLRSLDQALLAAEGERPRSSLRTLEDALAATRSANLAVISIPGGYVFREARKALEAGLNVFVFSSNVPAAGFGTNNFLTPPTSYPILNPKGSLSCRMALLSASCTMQLSIPSSLAFRLTTSSKSGRMC